MQGRGVEEALRRELDCGTLTEIGAWCQEHRAELLAALAARSAPAATMFDKIGADRLADEVARLIQRGVLDSRSPVADALLDYRETLRTAPAATPPRLNTYLRRGHDNQCELCGVPDHRHVCPSQLGVPPSDLGRQAVTEVEEILCRAEHCDEHFRTTLPLCLTCIRAALQRSPRPESAP